MRFLVPLLALCAVGCSAPVSYVNRPAMSTAVVLIPLNESMDPAAPLAMWKYVEAEVAQRGWKLVPRETVEQFYLDKKFTADPGEIRVYSNEELAKIFNADAVVWSQITAWRKNIAYKFTSYFSVIVTIEASLQDPKGAELWKGEGTDEKSSLHVWITGGIGVLWDFLKVGLVSCETYAPGAARECFWTMPRPGMDPQPPR